MIQALMIGLLVGATPQISWQSVFDEGFDEKAHGSILCPDGEGIIVAGQTHQDIWVYKLATANGDSIWAQIPDQGGNSNAGYDVALSPDGNLIYVGGLSAGMLSTYGYSGNGVLLWSTPIELDGVATGPSLCYRHPDTCYLATWCLRDITSHDAILYALSSEGNASSLWDSPGPHHALTGIDLDDDGNIYLSQSEFEGCRLWKRAFNGSHIWFSDYDFSEKGWQCRVGPTQEIFFCGEFTVTSKDFLLLKWDTEGNLLWNPGKHFDLGHDDYCRDLWVDAISDCYLAGWQVRGIEEDAALIKTDSAGNMLWSWIYEMEGNQEIEAIEVDENGYIYLAGSHHNGADWDMLVMQVRQPLMITGRVTDSTGAAMEGIAVALSGDTLVEVFTDTGGYYGIEVYNGGNYTVSPDLPGWAFTPPSHTYSPLAHREFDRNFSGEWTAIKEQPLTQSVRLECNSSEVSFTLPQSISIRLIVYDASGREAAVLAEGTYPAGTHQMSLPELKAGVYFVRLESGALTITGKTIVLQ